MANRKRKGSSSLIFSLFVIVAIILCVLFRAPLYDAITQITGADVDKDSGRADLPVTVVEGEIAVHVIDVGQGDAILITTPGGNMLIDAGDNISKYENALISYLDSQNVTELEYFVATHMHADHIGGADVILQRYTVNNVLMTDDVATTGVYEAMLDVIEQKNINVVLAAPGDFFMLGDVHCRILAPLDDYSNTNDQSIVIRATYGNVSMLFTGDAEGNEEGESEKDILARYSPAELQCDFLKVGHHGSNTSNSPALLRVVSPKIAAISCGEGNKYGHPLQSVLDSLDALGVTVYRTDLKGDLVFICDGESIWYQE